VRNIGTGTLEGTICWHFLDNRSWTYWRNCLFRQARQIHTNVSPVAVIVAALGDHLSYETSYVLYNLITHMSMNTYLMSLDTYLMRYDILM
jgi:hypothetical protein